jgi:hypothetical protein
MVRSGPIALLLLLLNMTPAAASRTIDLALPSQQPDSAPQRPVSEPNPPPSMGLDFFEAGLETEDGHEEAWPWPVNSDQ